MNIWEILYKEYTDSYRDIKDSKELVLEAKKALYSFITREMKDYRETKPPILIKGLDSPYIRLGRRINRIEFLDNISNEAYLQPSEGGFSIFIKKSLNYYRKRLCLAHEIAHTYFYKFHKNMPVHLASNKINFQVDWELDEGFTYEIAREILMPKFILRKFLKNNISLIDVYKLRRIFHVPISIVAKRIIHDLNYPNLCFIITKCNFYSKNMTIEKPKRHTIIKGSNFKYISIIRNWNLFEELILDNIDKDPGNSKFNLEEIKLDGIDLSLEFTRENKSIFIIIKKEKDNNGKKKISLDDFISKNICAVS